MKRKYLPCKICCVSSTCPTKVCGIPEICNLTVDVFGETFTVYFSLAGLTWQDLSDATHERCKICIPTNGGDLCASQFDLCIVDTSTTPCNKSHSCTTTTTITTTTTGNVVFQHVRYVDFKDFCIEVRRNKTTNQLSVKHTYTLQVIDQFSAWFEGSWTQTVTAGANTNTVTHVFSANLCSTGLGLPPNTNGTATCPSVTGTLLANNVDNCSPAVGLCGSISSKSVAYNMPFAFDSGWVDIAACAEILNTLTATSSNAFQHVVSNNIVAIPNLGCNFFPMGGFGFYPWCSPIVVNRLDSFTRNASPVTYQGIISTLEAYPWWGATGTWDWENGYQRDPASTLSCSVTLSDADCTPPSAPQMMVVERSSYIPVEHPGTAHWDELHSQRAPTQEWYADWVARIPSLGCDCSAHWASITTMFPPPFTSPQAFFVWSWYTHNLVNLQLARAEFPFAAALEKYAAPLAWLDDYQVYTPVH